MDTIRADEIIEITLSQANESLSSIVDGDVLFLCAPLDFGVDDFIRDEVEGLAENDDKKRKLVVLLETHGGFIETVERIVSVFRKHYRIVEFIVPNYSYSAGTVLALSGDEIYMDYYSVLGPIDPQFRTEAGRQAPGMGYIAKYRQLLAAINEADEGQVSSKKAELAFLLKKFDPADLFRIEQSIRHSESLIVEWLPRYKLKGWKKTETRGATVTRAIRQERARKIAKVLGDAEEWHSHGRGISRRDLESEKIGLKTVDFGADPRLNAGVRHYYGLCRDYMAKKGFNSALHTRNRLRRIP